MLRRLAARLVTGPAAFFLATVIDIVAFVASSMLRRRRERGQPGIVPRGELDAAAPARAQSAGHRPERG